MPIAPDDMPVQSMWKTVQEVFPHVTWNDFCRALDVTYHIQRGIKGRHCGNLGDKTSQYLAVAEYARACGPSRSDHLEVGTLFGGSCLMKLFALRDLDIQGKIVCIDPMSGFYGLETDFISGLPVNRDIFFENLKLFGFSPETIELRQCRSDAPAASAGLEENHFATVMIDGDHSYEGVRNDWYMYSQFVAKGGLVLIDDYAEPAWPHITVFVHELQDIVDRGWKRIGVVGTTFALCRGAFTRESRNLKDAPDIISIGQVLRQGKTGALDADDLREALKHLAEEDLNVRLGKVYLALAKNSLHEKRYIYCEEWLHRLLELENSSAGQKFEGFFQLGLCQILQGQTSEAIGNFQIALSVPSISVRDLFTATLELGSALVQIREHSKAESLYLRCLQGLELDEHQAYHIYVRLGNLYWVEKRVKEAERYYNMALAVEGIEDARRFHPLTGMAKALAMRKRYTDAEKMLLVALASDGIDNKNRAKALLELARCYSEQGKHGETIRALTSLNELSDLDPILQYQFHMDIGEAWMNLGDFSQAAEYFSRAGSVNGIPDHKKNLAHNSLGRWRHEQPNHI